MMDKLTSDLQAGLPAYGICDLSVVPVRAEHSDKAEITTQLLFGDTFTVLKRSEDLKWVYIETSYDEYLGWIDAKQYKSISGDFFETLKTHKPAYCKSLVGLVKNTQRFFPVTMGCLLPEYSNGIISIDNESYEFQGEVIYPDFKNVKELEMLARLYLSAPYLWGGKSHFGIDCSGFVQQVYKMNGITLPRDAYKQGEVGELVTFEERKPGDLAFFQNISGRIIHVGILLMNGHIIHASGEVRIDHFDEKGIFNVERQQYTHKLISIRRVLSSTY